ncbi:helix-turn-helix domain-containing protein [Streptomyces cyslabdanicus]|uniref:helix-turn-helix domain-containing protein n=1 Tax=Streptomyces cyslabdanicus TaxID=1470456 RepID=UPI0040441D6A
MKQEATESAPEPAPHSGTDTGAEGQNPRASARGASQRLRLIEQLTGRDLDRLTDRTELWLALLALEADPAGAPPGQ